MLGPNMCPGGPRAPIQTPWRLLHMCFGWTRVLETIGSMQLEDLGFCLPGARISTWSPIPALRRWLHTCFGCTRVPEGLGSVHCKPVGLCQPSCLPLFGPSPIPARISSWCPIPAPRRLLHTCFGWTSVLEGPMQLEYSPFSNRLNLPWYGKKGLRTVFRTRDRVGPSQHGPSVPHCLLRSKREAVPVRRTSSP